MAIIYKDLCEMDLCLTELLRPGDIVSFKGSFPVFANLVRFITRGPYGHSAIITEVSKHRIMMTEALTKVTSSDLMSCYPKDKLRFDIYRVENDELAKRAAHFSNFLMNEEYGWLQVASYYSGIMTGSWTPNRYLKLDKEGRPDSVYCSQLVVYCYFRAAKALNIKPIDFRKCFHWSMIDPNSLTFFSDKVKMVFSSIEEARIRADNDTIIAV